MTYHYLQWHEQQVMLKNGLQIEQSGITGLWQ